MQPSIDKLDGDILGELAEDASISVPTLANRIGANASVVYSRIRRLQRNGLIERYTIVIDKRALGYEVKAHVGINMSSRKRDDVISRLLRTDGVSDIAEVTGRFDVILTIYARRLDELHGTVADNIGKIDGVISSETFIEMKSVSRGLPHVSREDG